MKHVSPFFVWSSRPQLQLYGDDRFQVGRAGGAEKGPREEADLHRDQGVVGLTGGCKETAAPSVVMVT